MPEKCSCGCRAFKYEYGKWICLKCESEAMDANEAEESLFEKRLP